MKKVFIVILIFFVTACSNLKPQTKNIFVMDTYFEVKLYSDKDEKIMLDKIEDKFNYYHQLFDRYNEYDSTNLYSINNATNDLQLDQDLLNILNLANDLYSESNGLLDITLGKTIDVWKKAIALEKLPSPEELTKATQEKKELIIENGVLKANGVFIDLGAVAKGYALKKVAEFIKEEGYSKFLINAGGQVYAGSSYKKDAFKIGIKNPVAASNITVLNIENLSVSTSGNYERYFIEDGINYNHIIDPKTSYPANYIKSVSVVSKDAFLADALTTILFLMPVDEGMKFIKKYDAEAIFYDNDGKIFRTSGFSQYE